MGAASLFLFTWSLMTFMWLLLWVGFRLPNSMAAFLQLDFKKAFKNKYLSYQSRSFMTFRTTKASNFAPVIKTAEKSDHLGDVVYTACNLFSPWELCQSHWKRTCVRSITWCSPRVAVLPWTQAALHCQVLLALCYQATQSGWGPQGKDPQVSLSSAWDTSFLQKECELEVLW